MPPDEIDTVGADAPDVLWVQPPRPRHRADARNGAYVEPAAQRRRVDVEVTGCFRHTHPVAVALLCQVLDLRARQARFAAVRPQLTTTHHLRNRVRGDSPMIAAASAWVIASAGLMRSNARTAQAGAARGGWRPLCTAETLGSAIVSVLICR